MSWPDDGMKKRNEAIYFERLQGETFKKLSIKYGITGMRVAQIFNKIERYRRRSLINSLNQKALVACIPDPIISSVNVNKLNLSVRASNCLRNSNIETIGELCSMSSVELLQTKNMGRKTVKELKEILNEFGLRLKDDSLDITICSHKCPNCGHVFNEATDRG